MKCTVNIHIYWEHSSFAQGLSCLFRSKNEARVSKMWELLVTKGQKSLHILSIWIPVLSATDIIPFYAVSWKINSIYELIFSGINDWTTLFLYDSNKLKETNNTTLMWRWSCCLLFLCLTLLTGSNVNKIPIVWFLPPYHAYFCHRLLNLPWYCDCSFPAAQFETGLTIHGISGRVAESCCSNTLCIWKPVLTPTTMLCAGSWLWDILNPWPQHEAWFWIPFLK